MTQRIALRLLVSGDVHGVGFREFVRRTGQGLGLSGWVRNLGDGRVEAHAEGDARAVRALLDGCRRGPPASRVASVDASPSESEGLASFEIRPSSAASRPGDPGGGPPGQGPSGQPFRSPDG